MICGIQVNIAYVINDVAPNMITSDPTSPGERRIGPNRIVGISRQPRRRTRCFRARIAHGSNVVMGSSAQIASDTRHP